MMKKARMLKLEETMQRNMKVMWLETRDEEGAVAVTYRAEHRPFLLFEREDQPEGISVRPEYYGKTWRCWDGKPEGVTAWKSVS